VPFSELLKLRVKRRADFTCCWCNDRAKKVDVHHIIPEDQHGPDTEENAAPLCASCHDMSATIPRSERKSDYGEMPGMRDARRSFGFGQLNQTCHFLTSTGRSTLFPAFPPKAFN